MKIIPGNTYRIKGNSRYFREKYGTSNPIIEIEDEDVKLGQSVWLMNGNPAAMLYGMRSGLERLGLRGPHYYGKIGPLSGPRLGEFVNASELEPL